MDRHTDNVQRDYAADETKEISDAKKIKENGKTINANGEPQVIEHPFSFICQFLATPRAGETSYRPTINFAALKGCIADWAREAARRVSCAY